MLLHPLYTNITPPARFNNPFCYEPHPLCMLAARKLQGELAHAPFRNEIDSGKMFGVLVVELPPATHHPTPTTRLGYLQAYSGQIDYFDSPAITQQPSPNTQHPSPNNTHHPTPNTHHPITPITQHPTPITQQPSSHPLFPPFLITCSPMVTSKLRSRRLATSTK